MIGAQCTIGLFVKGEEVQFSGVVTKKIATFPSGTELYIVRLDNCPEEYQYIQDAQGGMCKSKRHINLVLI